LAKFQDRDNEDHEGVGRDVMKAGSASAEFGAVAKLCGRADEVASRTSVVSVRKLSTGNPFGPAKPEFDVTIAVTTLLLWTGSVAMSTCSSPVIVRPMGSVISGCNMTDDGNEMEVTSGSFGETKTV
jgi:hypothetical protein